MGHHASAAALLSVPLDERAAQPLYRQLYESIRRTILAGQFGAGMKLPATRMLAAELSVSRNTIVNAFDQLLAEGYLVGRLGSGTYVAPTLPDDLLQTRTQPQPVRRTQRTGRLMSRRGDVLAQAQR